MSLNIWLPFFHCPKQKFVRLLPAFSADAVLTQLNLIQFSAMKMVLRNFSYIVILALYVYMQHLFYLDCKQTDLNFCNISGSHFLLGRRESVWKIVGLAGTFLTMTFDKPFTVYLCWDATNSFRYTHPTHHHPRNQHFFFLLYICIKSHNFVQ
jgi:hypothetical protein